jgi:SAM-dependent methyltransferase
MGTKLEKTLQECNEFLDLAEVYESYSITNFESSVEDEVKSRTGGIYGNLWNKFPKDIVSSAENILKSRFSRNNLDLEKIARGKILDAGCGSGRYTLAIAKYGDEVIGLDFGDQGLEIANSLKSTIEIEDSRKVTFVKGDLLNLPFQDGEFDFVMSNGTAHHTTDPVRALHEVIRVTSRGGQAFIYLYGSGGIFWHTRKRLNKIMKYIPQERTSLILKALGMPGERFIFEDNWYVPIEHHMEVQEVEKVFKDCAVAEFQRLTYGTETDIYPTSPEDEEFFGSGELRYMVQK